MVIFESGFTGIAYPSRNPRIAGWPLTGTIAASSEVAGFAATEAANDLTYQLWRPSALPATWEVDFGGAETVSYFGIAAHSLGSSGNTVAAQVWSGGAWVTVATHTPQDDSPILVLCAAKLVSKARIVVSGGTVPDIAVIRFGDILEFPQPAAYVGRRDIQQLAIAEYRTTISDGGHVQGRYISRRGQSFTLAVAHLSETWKASDLDPLILHLETEAVFVADRPGEFPASVAFGQTVAPVVPERAVPNASVSISVSMEFVGHVA